METPNLWAALSLEIAAMGCECTEDTTCKAHGWLEQLAEASLSSS